MQRAITSAPWGICLGRILKAGEFNRNRPALFRGGSCCFGLQCRKTGRHGTLLVVPACLLSSHGHLRIKQGHFHSLSGPSTPCFLPQRAVGKEHCHRLLGANEEAEASLFEGTGKGSRASIGSRAVASPCGVLAGEGLPSGRQGHPCQPQLEPMHPPTNPLLCPSVTHF